MIHIASTDPSLDFEKHATVVYHKETGRVLHVHQVLARRGVDAPDEKMRAAKALEHAGKFGHDVSAAETLAVPHDTHGRHFRVDVAAKKLVAVEGSAPRH